MNKLLTFIFLLSLKVLFSQSHDSIEPCMYWHIEPLIFNNIISDSTEFNYWNNYSYFKDDDTSKLIPDSLKFRFLLSPSLELVSLGYPFCSNYTLKSILRFKYGNHDNSYNVINPRISNDVILFEQEISLKKIFDSLISTDEYGYWIDNSIIKAIPIKTILDSLNVSIEDKPWDLGNRGRPFALNQIIIYTYFIDSMGVTKCMSELTLPINGAYNDPKCGMWEF
jgi:hypothetical protein